MAESNNLQIEANIDLEKIEKMIGKERFQHTKLVLKAALELSKQLQLKRKDIEKAALLHDIAKNKKEKELKIILNNSAWEIDPLEFSITAVLHAPAGAVVAEKEFGIKKRKILEAIRYHTLGHPEMSELAQLIYAADFISEDRSFIGLDEIRVEIKENFKWGLYLITTEIIKYQLNQKNAVHPFSNDLRNKLLK